VWQEVNAFVPSEQETGNRKQEIPEVVKHERFGVLKQLAAIIAWQEKAKEPQIKIQETKDKIQALVGQVNFEKALHAAQTEEMLFQTERLYGEDERVADVVQELTDTLNKKVLEYQREKLKEELRQAEAQGDSEKEKTVMQRIHDVSKKLQEIVTTFYK
jgi:arginine/lysine/ornithine decarboxylase